MQILALLSLFSPRNRESDASASFEVIRGHSATHRHMRGAGICHSPFGCQLCSDTYKKHYPLLCKNELICSRFVFEACLSYSAGNPQSLTEIIASPVFALYMLCKSYYSGLC